MQALYLQDYTEDKLWIYLYVWIDVYVIYSYAIKNITFYSKIIKKIFRSQSKTFSFSLDNKH